MKAAIYLRISKDSEKKGLGVKRQREDCEALAAKLGWEVVEVVPENDTKASNGAPRPKYEKMLRMAATGQIEAIIGWDLDRVTRTPGEAEDLFVYARTVGLQLKSHNGDLDLETPQGKLTTRVRTAVSAFEIEQTQQRMLREKQQAAEAGRYNGPRPFGYDFETDDHGRALSGSAQRLVVNAAEAAVIREGVRRVLDGDALWSIKNDFNERGITTSTGAPWQSQTLRRMLLRWVNAGYRKHQRYEGGRWVGSKQLYPGLWEAIIDEDTHERVLATLTDPRRVSNKGDTGLKYLLTWLVTCGACGWPMAGAKSYEYTVKGYKRKDGSRSPSRRRVYPAKYVCPHSGCHGVNRRMDVVDEFVERHVVALLEAEGVRVLGGDQQVIGEARERVEALQAKMDLLSDSWMDGRMTQAQFDRQNARLMTQLESEQSRLQAAQLAEGLDEFTGMEAGAAWLRANVERKRMVLRALIELADLRITIDKIGPGAFSAAGADPYMGIRIEWD